MPPSQYGLSVNYSVGPVANTAISAPNNMKMKMSSAAQNPLSSHAPPITIPKNAPIAARQNGATSFAHMLVALLSHR
jgi:hypothetical protein